MFEKREIGVEYGSLSELFEPEAAILKRFRPQLKGARILDLGVGAGRTTSHLLQVSANYIGADYSHEMIKRAGERFPEVKFEVLDARDMSRFVEGSFDLVMFSFNGLDCVGHDDRLTIMREVHRILKSDGLFIFSSHNRNTAVRKPWPLSHLNINPLRQPLRFGRRVGSYIVGIANYLRSASRVERTDEYCVINDAAHRYSLMLYYIDAEAQMAQLRRHGFDSVEAVDLDGRWLSQADCRTTSSKWIHYVCRASQASTLGTI